MRLPTLLAVLEAASVVYAQSCANLPKEAWEKRAKDQGRTLCYLEPQGGSADDGTLIAASLRGACKSNSLVVLPGKLYNIKSFMDTTNLNNVHLHIFGRLLWDTDINKWLGLSQQIGFQNQSTVWFFGGDGVVWNGHGTGTLDGNGQVWYDWAKGEGNIAKRPMMINWLGLNNSVVRKQRFVQSQMWTMATTWCNNVTFEDIYVNNTSNSGQSTLNTDGMDTIFSDNITFRRWDVTCGDDHIALKRNSTNIRVYDSIFRGGQGFAIGSLAQYAGEYDNVEHFYASNMTMLNTRYIMYLKTWPGTKIGNPPNGGGGGTGQAVDIVVDGATIAGARSQPVTLYQNEHYSGGQWDEDSSTFKFRNIHFRNIKGTVVDSRTYAGFFKCSKAAGGCHDITMENFDFRYKNGTALKRFQCRNLNDFSFVDAAGKRYTECEPFPPTPKPNVAARG